MAAALTLGPILGVVTTTTGRVLIESRSGGPHTVTLTPPQGDSVAVTLDTVADTPAVFEFGDMLRPGTAYRVSVDMAGAAVEHPASVLRTLPDQGDGRIGPLRIAVVSCDKPRPAMLSGDSPSLWEALASEAAAGLLDLAIHCGDQVYCDPEFEAAVSLIESGQVERQSPEFHTAVRDLYRNRYRSTWGAPSTAAALANVPNVAIWDDHEIRDDFGALPEDSDPESLAFEIASIARSVYREYQGALSRSELIDIAAGRESEHIVFRLGHVGFILLDQRSGRSFAAAVLPSPHAPYLGNEQWDVLDSVLAPSGQLGGPDTTALVVATSVPLVFLNQLTTDAGSNIPPIDDLKDHWAYGSHADEQLRLINLLLDWKYGSSEATAPLNGRSLTVVAGDVHLGLHSTISRPCSSTSERNNQQLVQLTSSAITNEPPSPALSAVIRAALQTPVFLRPGTALGCFFEHTYVCDANNYGKLIIQADGAAESFIVSDKDGVVAFPNGAQSDGSCCSIL